ncbi:MAG: signal peptidase II [Chloroflexi bacterium]|nr:signal peptidase II [Chloroflexota bacterium]
MKRAGHPLGKWRNVVFALTALLVVAADQLSKLWIRSNLVVGQSLPATGLFQLTHAHNSGAAFGLFQGQSFLLTLVALVGIGTILLLVFFFSHHFSVLNDWLTGFALGLILGGTIGNLTDRLRLGYVTDFIDIGIWPAFNIADSAIVIGVILFAYSLRLATRVRA